MKDQSSTLKIKRLGIDTYREAVIYMREDCHICSAEGFEVQARIRVTLGDQFILATLHMVESHLLASDEVGLSNYAWKLLNANEGDIVTLSHPKPLRSLSYVRRKIYGHTLGANEIMDIIEDVTAGRYSDIHNAAFLTSCAGGHMNQMEIEALTKAMVHVGERLSWPQDIIVDKHSVGGVPGNRTTLIVVPIVAAYGLTIPKTSSRAITSPAGTADTMEVIAPVELNISQMQKVVEQEQGCIVWGGAVDLSPADDILIRVESAIELDSEGQLVASVLSKKISAGSSHIVIDMPIGNTAKIRTEEMAQLLQGYLATIGQSLGVHVETVFTDGSQPVGQGIGPALEARDVLAVLQGNANAPKDLRERALTLAARILEFSPDVNAGEGKQLATQILNDGRAWRKFQAICSAQGGFKDPEKAKFTHVITAKNNGQISTFDNRKLSRIAKLAGAPRNKTAGLDLHIKIGDTVGKQQPLFTIHAESKGELEYALSLYHEEENVITMELR